MSDSTESRRLARALAPGNPASASPPSRDALWRNVQEERARVRRARSRRRLAHVAAVLFIAISTGVWCSVRDSRRPLAIPPPGLTESLRVIDASLAALSVPAVNAQEARVVEEARFLQQLRDRLVADAQNSALPGGTE